MSALIAQGRIERACRCLGTEMYRRTTRPHRSSLELADQPGADPLSTELLFDGEGLKFHGGRRFAVGESSATDLLVGIDGDQHQLAIRCEVLEQPLEAKVLLGIDGCQEQRGDAGESIPQLGHVPYGADLDTIERGLW